MADKQVRIVISAQDSFSAVVQKYSAAMGQAAADTKKLDAASKQTDGGLTGLNNQLNNLMGVFAGIKILSFAGDMVTLGNTANATRATFVALSGDVTTATSTLKALRAETGGIVTDVDLMSGANRLLAMNIATSGQQAAELAGVAVNLGRAFEQEAGPAIENFSLMIANQSLLRLDSLGISAAAVRERMKELANEFPDMDKQARFTQATLEQATVTVDRLGSSIEAAQTPVAKLATSFENLKTSIGQGFANTVNSAITTLDQIVEIGKMQAGTSDIQIAAQERAQAFANTYFDTFAEEMGKQGISRDSNRELFASVLAEGFMEVEKNPDLMFDQTGMIVSALDQSLANIPGELRPKFYDALFNVFQAQEIDTLAATAAQENAAAYTLAFNAAMAGSYGGHETLGDDVDPYAGLTDFFAGGDPQGLNNLLAQMEGAQAALGQFQANAGGSQFIDAGAMDNISAQFEKLQELNEQGLITDDSLAKAEEFRDKAQAAADAFEKMSVTDVFGQSSGGMEGEIGDIVIDRMKADGASPEAIAAAQRQFDISSGRETAASLAMDEQLAPVLADLAELDPAMAAQGIENTKAFLEAAALLELTPEQIAAGLQNGAPGMIGGGSGGSFTVLPGQGIGQVAGQYGMTPQAVMGAAGNGQYIFPGTYPMGGGLQPDPNFDPNAYAQGIAGTVDQGAEGAVNPLDMAAVATDKMKENTADIIDQVDQIATGADAVTKAFDMAAAPRTVQITVETVDKTGGLLKAILGGLQPGTIMLGGNVRDNGGRVAGQDGRVGQKPGLTR